MEKSKVYVFLSECDYNAPLAELFPAARGEEIANTKNQRLRCEKQGVWQLLTFALDRLGQSIESVKPYKTDCGKWCSDSLYFSLSHSDSLLGVAISSEPVGIDIENIEDFATRYSDSSHLSGFLDKIRTDNEDNTPIVSNLLSLWTAKESIYKMLGEGTFSPSKLDTTSYNITEFKCQSEGKTYHVSLCTNKQLTNPKTDVVIEYIKKM